MDNIRPAQLSIAYNDVYKETLNAANSWRVTLSGSLSDAPAKAATCTQDGNSAYWTCDGEDAVEEPCGKYFSDAEGTEENEKDSWIIPATGHDWGEWKEYDETSHSRVCANDASHIEYADHEWDEGVTADRETTYTCTVCGAKKTETEAYIPATGITLNKKSAMVATRAKLQLTATITPSDATDQTVTWTSSDLSIVKVDSSGLVTAKKYGKATITATTADGASASCVIRTRFHDVNDPGKSYYNAVYWAVDNGITNATVAFSPEAGVTRGQAALMLWRWAGKMSVSVKKSPFTDVKTGKSDTFKAIVWGSKNGIIKGYSDGTYRKNEACTRANAVTFLYRYDQG